MVKSLKVGPYVLNLMVVYGGPLLAAEGETEALAELLNHAVKLPDTGIAEAIRTAGAGEGPAASVFPPEHEEEDRALRAAWAAKTGEQLGKGQVAKVVYIGSNVPEVPVSWEALRKGLAELEEIRAGWVPEPGPWLFVRPSLRPFVTPEDEALVRSLEKEAQAIDELDFRAEVGREPASLIARRRKFLTACRDAGVFSPDYGAARDQWLQLWAAERLLALRRAAARLRAWNLFKEDEQPPDGSACLDYVRLQLWPPGEDGEAWAGSALRLLPAASEDDQGAAIEKVGSSIVTVWWRRDGERPALLAVARG